jgi:putative membrane protein
MKRVLRNIIIAMLTIYLLGYVNPGFTYTNGYKTIVLAGFVMFFLDTIVEPVIRIIFIPINFLTLGLFSWIIGFALFYALVYFVPAVKITGWDFPGFHQQIYQQYALTIPSFSFNFWTNIILLSVMYNLISGTIRWLCEDHHD